MSLLGNSRCFEVLSEEGWEVVKENTTKGEVGLSGSCRQAWCMSAGAENLASTNWRQRGSENPNECER